MGGRRNSLKRKAAATRMEKVGLPTSRLVRHFASRKSRSQAEEPGKTGSLGRGRGPFPFQPFTPLLSPLPLSSTILLFHRHACNARWRIAACGRDPPASVRECSVACFRAVLTNQRASSTSPRARATSTCGSGPCSKNAVPGRGKVSLCPVPVASPQGRLRVAWSMKRIGFHNSSGDTRAVLLRCAHAFDSTCGVCLSWSCFETSCVARPGPPLVPLAFASPSPLRLFGMPSPFPHRFAPSDPLVALISFAS